MKVKVSFTVDIDREQWIEQYSAGDPMSAAEIRNDVRSVAEMEISLRFGDEGVLQ